VILVLAAAGLAVLLVLLLRNGGEVPPSPALPLRLEAARADLFFLDAQPITRRGPPRFWVLRFDPGVELVPHHFRSAGLAAPQPIEGWGETLGAPVIFNAGQFDDRLDHLGWLKADDRWLVERRHAQFQALLVSGPRQGAPFTGIIDLAQGSERVVEGFRHVVQSMMLVDEQGKARVRDSELTACRTVVAQDRRGRILVLVSEGAMTLGDLARWLPGAGLDLVRAMNLDGGIESQLLVSTSELKLAVYGQYGTGATVFDAGTGQIRYPLPAVIAVRPPAAEGAAAP
jgi:hypothetical protein